MMEEEQTASTSTKHDGPETIEQKYYRFISIAVLYSLSAFEINI